MDPEIRKQVAIMLGQQAIEVVEKLLVIQARDGEIRQLRQDLHDTQNRRDQLEGQVEELRGQVASLSAALHSIPEEHRPAILEWRGMSFHHDEVITPPFEDDPAPDA